MFRVARIMMWLPQLLLLLADELLVAEARWTVRPRRPTTTTTEQPDRHHHVHHWPPLIAPKPSTSYPSAPHFDAQSTEQTVRLVDGFEYRLADGQHEYRYQLSNGDTRYERTYWLPVGKNWVLARRGYYSVPLPNAQYSTVFYRADNQGYHVDTHTLSGKQPLLPRTMEIPHRRVEATTKSTPASKRNSISVPERNEDAQKTVGNTNETKAPTQTQTQIQTESQTETQNSSTLNAKVQAVVEVQNSESHSHSHSQSESRRQSQSHSKKLIQNKTKPSTVAKVDDILATEVEIAAVDVHHYDVNVVNDHYADDDDDDGGDDDVDDVTESQQNTRA